MSFRAGLLPTLIRPCPAFRPTQSTFIRSFHPSPSSASFGRPALPSRFRQPPPHQQLQAKVISARSSSAGTGGAGQRRFSPLGLGIAAALTATSLSLAFPSRQVRCDSTLPISLPTSRVNTADPAPQSILSLYELSFGAVCGICSGVFIKKGARALAFLLGGVFVLLQYLSSKSYISVDWTRLSSKYDTAFGTKSATGSFKGPTLGGVWNRFVDFLTSNFQQRASFMAGLALGIRLG